MGALWDANAKRWYITEHHNPEDFKFWSPCEDDEQEIEEEQESEEEQNLNADDYIDDIYEHLNKLYDLLPEDQTTKTNEQEETVELLEKKETPQEEYSRHLEETKKEAIYYASKHMLDYDIEEEVEQSIKEKSYADNFKYKRIRTDI